MAKTANQSELALILKELQDIKRLLAFSMLHNGVSQAEVATGLGVDQSSVSRMFPKKTTKGNRSRKSR